MFIKLKSFFINYEKHIITKQIKDNYKMMSELNECPICMDVIGEKNCVTTDCGHQFHANCMFTNIDRNGFKCPCCRAQMIKEDDETDSPTYSDDDSIDSSSSIDDDDEPFNDDALRGLRLLTNLLEGEEPDQEDVVAEYNYVNDPEENEMPVVHFPPPPRQVIEQRLRQQGVTYEQLVAWVLIDHDEYADQQQELETVSGDIWEKMNILITEYEIQPVPEPVQEKEEPFDVFVPISPIPNVDDVYEIAMKEYRMGSFEERMEDFDDLCMEDLRMEDLDDLRMDLAHFMVDYSAQPKTHIYA